MRLEERPDAGYGAGFCSKVRSATRSPDYAASKGARASRYNTAMGGRGDKWADVADLVQMHSGGRAYIASGFS
jgi:hypothetical protein